MRAGSNGLNSPSFWAEMCCSFVPVTCHYSEAGCPHIVRRFVLVACCFLGWVISPGSVCTPPGSIGAPGTGADFPATRPGLSGPSLSQTDDVFSCDVRGPGRVWGALSSIILGLSVPSLAWSPRVPAPVGILPSPSVCPSSKSWAARVQLPHLAGLAAVSTPRGFEVRKELDKVDNPLTCEHAWV